MGVAVERIQLGGIEVHLVAVETVEVEGLVDARTEIGADAHARNELAVVVSQLYHLRALCEKGELRIEFGIEGRVVLARSVVEKHQHPAYLETLVGIVCQCGERAQTEPGLDYLISLLRLHRQAQQNNDSQG